MLIIQGRYRRLWEVSVTVASFCVGSEQIINIKQPEQLERFKRQPIWALLYCSSSTTRNQDGLLPAWFLIPPYSLGATPYSLGIPLCSLTAPQVLRWCLAPSSCSLIRFDAPLCSRIGRLTLPLSRILRHLMSLLLFHLGNFSI